MISISTSSTSFIHNIDENSKCLTKYKDKKVVPCSCGKYKVTFTGRKSKKVVRKQDPMFDFTKREMTVEDNDGRR